MKNAINWFEIPATDLDRAQKFYESIFDEKMMPMAMGDLKMVLFPGAMEPGTAGGALMQHPMYQPSESAGVLVYLNANPNIQAVVDRIESAGGKVVIPKTQISPEIGYMAVFLDTEGNRIALHANG